MRTDGRFPRSAVAQTSGRVLSDFVTDRDHRDAGSVQVGVRCRPGVSRRRASVSVVRRREDSPGLTARGGIAAAAAACVVAAGVASAAWAVQVGFLLRPAPEDVVAARTLAWLGTD